MDTNKSLVSKKDKKKCIEKIIECIKRNKKNIFLFIAIIVIVIFIATPFILYRCRFQGEMSYDHLIWGYFGDYLSGTLTPIISIMSICIAFLAFYQTQKNQKEILNDKRQSQLFRLMTQYSSNEIGLAIYNLWDYYKKFKSRNIDKVNDIDKAKDIDIYDIKQIDITELKKNKIYEPLKKDYLTVLDNKKTKECMDWDRRKVSYFYFHLAIYAKRDNVDKDLIRIYWSDERTIKLLMLLEQIVYEHTESDKVTEKPNKNELFKEFLDIIKVLD